MKDVCEKYEEDFKTWEKPERNFREIIVKYEKKWIFLESFKRKLKLLESPEWKPAGNLRKKWKKNAEEFKRDNIKLIKLKNRKKGNLKFRKTGKEFKEKLRGMRQTGIKLF